MQISSLLSIFILFSSSSLAYASGVHDFAPTPEPSSPAAAFPPSEREPLPDDGFGFASGDYSPPAPPRSSNLPSPLPAPALAPAGQSGLSPASAEGGARGSADEDSGESSSPPAAAAESEETVRWCTVRGEMEDCRFLLNLLSQSSNYTWTCVIRDSTAECLDSIRKGEADIINLEAGAAFAAFLNSSMKAIANEVYCNRAESYEAVAVVPRKSCEAKRGLSLMDFKGHRSCHGEYSSASGWTYPIDHIKKSVGSTSDKMDDVDVAANFFSKVCAPSSSGLGRRGICSGCGDENENGTSCDRDSLYYGDTGSFRCLMEGLGDVAFVRGDTALLYSMEGPYNQSWSKRSVRDFMYLCPQGGCREINGYPGACSFGTVPANTIMASNSIQNHKRLHVLERLANSSWIEAAYVERISSIHMVSPSTQEFTQIKTLTRSYLGRSASISESIQHSKTQKTESSASGTNSFPDRYSMLWVLLSAALACCFCSV
ncbi:lactotransferrin-like [Eucalyptus grandis]|uniref:lactotransferrin-like n=1 Tax=Eucalyptus grandis TaxID=71139 RepID=UPI00192EF665|nr:lactotransferrin-like [Eucalyptus grandis]